MFSVIKNDQLKRNIRILISSLDRTRFPKLTAASSSKCQPPEGCNKNLLIGSGSGESKHMIKYQQYVTPVYTDHDHKNMGLNRPMSPHLTVYAPTQPAMLSIVQRATGTILTFYALLLSGGALFLSNGMETYVSIIQSLDLSRFTIIAVKILLGLPFGFHYFNGIRYCLWNIGKKLQIKDLYSTGNIVIIAGAVLSILFGLL